MGAIEARETIAASDALAIVAGKAGKGASAPTPSAPGFVCKACGVLLTERDGEAVSGNLRDKCPGSGPHVGVLVDLNTAVVDDDLRVVRAVHLE